MKKKILILISLLFLLCGCSATVDLNVTSTEITETVSITSYATSTFTKEQIKNSFREYTPAYAENVIVDTMPDEKEKGVEYYDRTLKELNNGYNFIFKYKFPINKYVNANTVKNSFASASVQKDNLENTMTLATDSGGMLLFKEYPDLTNVTVNITSEYKVIESNADTSLGNVYTWYLTPNDNKSIYIIYDTSNGTSTSNNNGTGGENSGGNNSLGNTGSGENENLENEENGNITIVIKDEDEEESEFTKFINRHPILVALGSLAIFFIFVIIISKVSKQK